MVIGSFLLEHLAFFYAAGGKTRSRDGRKEGVAGEVVLAMLMNFSIKKSCWAS